MAQIVDTFGDFIYEEPQTGGGTPIDAFTQPTYTPFLLNQIEIDEITIKKIYDLFPRSLRVAQLTSNQLLDLLRSQVDEKDAEIQRLLEIIASFSETTLDLSTLESLLSSLGGELTGGILDALDDAGVQVDDAQLSQQIANLQSNGYVRIGQTLLFAKVVDVPQTNNKFINIPFVAVQAGRGTLGFDNPITLNSPTQVILKNIGNDTVYFTRGEVWSSNDDGLRLPTNPTNVFKFSTYSQEAKVYTIQGNSGDIIETISLGYPSLDSIWDSIGLNDDGQNTTIYNGSVYILASNENIVGTINNSRLKSGTSIGSCKVQRRG